MSQAATIAACALSALLVGCSGSNDNATDTPSPPAAAPGSAQPSTPAEPAKPVGRGEVTGSKTLRGTAGEVQVDVRGLHRDGKLLRLDYTLVNTSAAKLYAPAVLPLLPPTEVTLLDTTALKKYLVVKDSTGQYALQAPNVYLEPQGTFDGSAYFAAPPSDVTSLTLEFGKIGTFETPVS